MATLSASAQAPLPAAQAPWSTIQLKLPEALKQAQGFLAKGELDKAEHIANAILAKHAQHTVAMQILAAVAEKRGHGARAIEILQRSISGTGDDALPWMNLCRLFRLSGRLDEARAAGERATALGTLPDALIDLADTYVALGETDLALEAFERAVAKNPKSARARLGLAQALLMKGEFRAAWPEYEWRYKLTSTENILPKFKQPQWNGMTLKSSSLLIVAEQGYGDCFQFARYLPLVSERAKNVYVGVGAEMKSVLATVPGRHLCFERWEHIPPFDYQIPLSSLPMVFGTTLETIPATVPYVFAEPAKVEAWRVRLSESSRGRKSVGFVWQGRPTHPNDRVRSIGLGPLTPLLEADDILPVSMQFGEGREQLARHPMGARVFDAAAEIKDFSDSAALIAALDCVVSIDSANAHLAGALGKPCLVMLPYAGEWRWLEGRRDSPWYPTLELFRQEAHGAWDGVVARVVERIRGTAFK